MSQHDHRSIEIRRHAERHKPGDNLNARGVARARNASARDRAFALVVTSPLPRAIQTAVAMGHSVDEEDWNMASMGEVVSAPIVPAPSFDAIREIVRTDRTVGAYAALQAIYLRRYLSRIGPGESLLVVSHGGIAEIGIIGFLHDVDVGALGARLDTCEGALLELDGDRCRRVSLFRFDGSEERGSLILEY